MTVLGKFSVVMADPPWDIHMEVVYIAFPYSTIVLLIHNHATRPLPHGMRPNIIS